LSYREIEEIGGLRGVNIDHATLQRWIIKFMPTLEGKFRKRKMAVNGSWRMDETYIKVKGKWVYWYNYNRPHQSLSCSTPAEILYKAYGSNNSNGFYLNFKDYNIVQEVKM
jgi:hypothetical protein